MDEADGVEEACDANTDSTVTLFSKRSIILLILYSGTQWEFRLAGKEGDTELLICLLRVPHRQNSHTLAHMKTEREKEKLHNQLVDQGHCECQHHWIGPFYMELVCAEDH